MAQGGVGFSKSTATGLALSFTFQPAFQAFLLNLLLGNKGVAQVFGGNSCDLHEILASE